MSELSRSGQNVTEKNEELPKFHIQTGTITWQLNEFGIIELVSTASAVLCRLWTRPYLRVLGLLPYSNGSGNQHQLCRLMPMTGFCNAASRLLPAPRVACGCVYMATDGRDVMAELQK